MPWPSRSKSDSKSKSESEKDAAAHLKKTPRNASQKVDLHRLITLRIDINGFRKRLDTFLSEIYNPLVLQLNMLLHAKPTTREFHKALLVLEDFTQSYKCYEAFFFDRMTAADIARKVNKLIDFYGQY
jgi:hypothetical protein